MDCCAGVVKWLDNRVLCVVRSLHGAACPLYVWVLSIVNGPFHMRKKCSSAPKDVETSIKVSSFAKEWVSSQPKRAP